ncbi:autotransporter domain-containing protein [Candidatus Pelagibacter sp.]|nr:autotransporter domain-containing protein [Candidatus Pelagibacter sp.]
MKLIIRIFTIIFFCSLSCKSFAGVTYLGDGELLDINGSPSRNNETAGIAWNNNGSQLFVMGTGDDDDELLEYSCLTNYDVSTCSYVRELPLNNDHEGSDGPINVTQPFGFTFDDDGSHVYVSSIQNNTIYEIQLGSAFNLSSATKRQEIASVDGTPCGITFSNDGRQLFLAGFAQHKIIVWPLSTAYSLASNSVGTPAEYDVSSQSRKPRDIDFNSDGTKMYIVSAPSNRYVSVYSLTTAFDLSDGFSHLGNFTTVNEQDSQPFSIEFNNDGTKFYMNGYQYDSVYEYSLNTAFELIAADPTLTSSVPANNATGVAVDANIILNFSENVVADSGDIKIYKTGGVLVETIGVTSGQVTGTGTSQITINPGTDFEDNTGYYVLIDATAFDDVDSGSYVGISSTTDRSFTTVNTIPTLTSSVPANNATGVAVDANIILNFSENVVADSGDIKIYKTGGVLVETIGVTSGQVTGTGTSQITINPGTDFEDNTGYYVLIDATAFDDVDSGSYVGISSTTDRSFTIKAMVDPTTDKDVTGTIDAQNMMAKNTLTEFTSIVNDRLRYLRQNRINKDFTKNNIKLDFGNAMLTSLAKVIPTSNIYLKNEILSSLATVIPTSNVYLTNEILTSLTKTIPTSNVYLTDYVPKNWSSWSEGSVSMTKVGDSKNSSSKNIDVQSLALGFDTKLNNNDLLGFVMQFSQSDSEVGTSSTGIDSNNYSLSAYRTRPLNNDNFVEGLFGVVLTENELVRKSGANTLTGSRNGTQIFGSINYGKTIDKEDFNLTPIARVDFGYTELDAYSESGTDALTYGKQTVESGLVSIGLEINDNIKFSNSSLQPFGSFKYGLDFSNSSDAKMNYVSDTSTIYTYTPGINSTHLLTAEAGFNYELKDHLKLTGIFKRIQGNESQQTNNVRFGFHYISQRETEYAMSLDGSDELKTGLNISKKINGFDIKLGSNYSLMSQVPDYGVNLKISNKF